MWSFCQIFIFMYAFICMYNISESDDHFYSDMMRIIGSR